MWHLRSAHPFGASNGSVRPSRCRSDLPGTEPAPWALCVKTSHSAAHDATLGQLGRSPQGQPGGKSLGWEGQGTAFGGALAHQPVSSPWPWPMNGPEARGSPGAQQYGAVAPTTTSTQAASSLEGCSVAQSGELLPNHPTHTPGTGRETTDQGPGLACG